MVLHMAAGKACCFAGRLPWCLASLYWISFPALPVDHLFHMSIWFLNSEMKVTTLGTKGFEHIHLKRQVNLGSRLWESSSLWNLLHINNFKSKLPSRGAAPTPPEVHLAQSSRSAVWLPGPKAPLSLCSTSLALSSFILFGDERLCLKGQFWWCWLFNKVTWIAHVFIAVIWTPGLVLIHRSQRSNFDISSKIGCKLSCFQK